MKTPMIQEILALVTFNRDANGNLVINDVFGHVSGSVMGNVRGNVKGNIGGCVWGSVGGDVQGKVKGTINGCKWKFIETPKEKVIRLIREGKSDEAIQALQEGE
jgi:uncharacterized membrane protein